MAGKIKNLGGTPLIGQPPKHIQLMLEEADVLGQRLAAIDEFCELPQFEALNQFERHLLQAQSAAMQTYLRILLMRITRASPKLDS